ncbi:hypothetical protein HYQ46_011364 [Verticillium longisporum]|nr:hypothetical protein HYQ46_011364 [Verticillium longisporum]
MAAKTTTRPGPAQLSLLVMCAGTKTSYLLVYQNRTVPNLVAVRGVSVSARLALPGPPCSSPCDLQESLQVAEET